MSTDAKIPHPAPSPSDGESVADRPGEGKSVERLFPFVLKSRVLIVGRDTLVRSKGRLHFVLITTDISEKSREQILKDFAHYPVVQRYTEADLETYFGVKRHEGRRFREVRPGAIHLRGVEGAPHQPTGDEVQADRTVSAPARR